MDKQGTPEGAGAMTMLRRDGFGTGMLAARAGRGNAPAAPAPPAGDRTWPRRALLLGALAAAAGWSLSTMGATDTAEAVGRAGADLTRLLRFMAVLKASLAAAALAAVWWRLACPLTPGRLLAYLTAGAAMAAGPVLIWGMAHVGLGALLLHGGLFGALATLWRDPAVAARLGTMVAARRGRGRHGAPRSQTFT